jgi:hypothetical protein
MTSKPPGGVRGVIDSMNVAVFMKSVALALMRVESLCFGSSTKSSFERQSKIMCAVNKPFHVINTCENELRTTLIYWPHYLTMRLKSFRRVDGGFVGVG